MNRLKPIELNRTRGYPFAIAFAFLPEGTKMLTGSVDNIDEFLVNGPTCHGVVNQFGSYNQKWKYITLFGKNTRIFGDPFNFYLQHHPDMRNAGRKDNAGFNELFYLYAKQFITSRVKSILTVSIRLPGRPDNSVYDRYYILGAWRTMPSRYLDEFRLFDPENPFGVCLGDIYNGKHVPWRSIRERKEVTKTT